MLLTTDEYIDRIAKRTVENSENIKQKDRQRRHQVVDIYGMEFTRQGGPNVPATFYVSISPDMVYLERFEFKLIIAPFLSTAGPVTSPSQLEVGETSIIPADYARVEGTTLIFDHDTVIDPHTHTITDHSHGQRAGAVQVPVTATDFLVSIEGIDVTPYLMAQYSPWISGEGVYPSLAIGEDYDVLEVASDFVAEGRKEEADILTRAGYKKIEITSESLFSVTLVNYLKYSHSLR